MRLAQHNSLKVRFARGCERANTRTVGHKPDALSNPGIAWMRGSLRPRMRPRPPSVHDMSISSHSRHTPSARCDEDPAYSSVPAIAGRDAKAQDPTTTANARRRAHPAPPPPKKKAFQGLPTSHHPEPEAKSSPGSVARRSPPLLCPLLFSSRSRTGPHPSPRHPLPSTSRGAPVVLFTATALKIYRHHWFCLQHSRGKITKEQNIFRQAPSSSRSQLRGRKANRSIILILCSWCCEGKGNT